LIKIFVLIGYVPVWGSISGINIFLEKKKFFAETRYLPIFSYGLFSFVAVLVGYFLLATISKEFPVSDLEPDPYLSTAPIYPYISGPVIRL
jgi:hypothetical protein